MLSRSHEDEIRKMDDDDSHSRCCGIGPVGGMPLLRHSDVWGAVCKALSAGVPGAVPGAMPQGVSYAVPVGMSEGDCGAVWAGVPKAVPGAVRSADLPLPGLCARCDGGGARGRSGVPRVP